MLGMDAAGKTCDVLQPKEIPTRTTKARTMFLKTACVFCGSSPGKNPAFANDAQALGQALAAEKVRLVYGGGSLGLMGITAKSALEAGGEVVGVIPDFLQNLERPTLPLTELIVTTDMHQRKMNMWLRADGFIVLPGGVGTLEELLEQITWVQLGQHRKPIILLDTLGYWDPLLAMFEHMRAAGFIRQDLEIHYRVAATPAEAVALFHKYATDTHEIG